MARSYRQHAGKQAGHYTQTIVLCAALVCAVLCSCTDVQAAFSIITTTTTEQTPCYWIQADMLELCSGKRLNLSDVKSIDGSKATAEESNNQKQAALVCMQMMESYLLAEKELISKEQVAFDQLKIFEDAGVQQDKKLRKRRIKQVKKLLKELLREAKSMQARWNAMRIPDYRLLQLRDIKVVQYSIRLQVYSEWLLYLKKNNLTRKAYAQEHNRRIQLLEKRFRLKLDNARQLTEQGGLNAPFERERQQPQQSGVSTIPAQ